MSRQSCSLSGNAGSTPYRTFGSHFSRVHARSDETPWDDDRKLRAMKLRLLEQAGGKLAEQVVSKVRHLSALRQAKERKSVAAQAGPAPQG